MKKWLTIALTLLALCFISFVMLGWFQPRLSFRIVTEINRPADKVFEALMDIEKAGQWMTSFKRLEMLSGNPRETGSRMRLYFDEDGETVIVDEEIVSIQPNASFKFSMSNQVLEGTGEFQLAEDNGKTTLVYINDTAGKNFFWRSMLCLAYLKIRERYVDNFAKLKAIVESGP